MNCNFLKYFQVPQAIPKDLLEKAKCHLIVSIAHVRYIKIQLETIDITTTALGAKYKDLYGLHHKAS